MYRLYQPPPRKEIARVAFGAIVTTFVVLFGVVFWITVIFGVLWALFGGSINLG